MFNNRERLDGRSFQFQFNFPNRGPPSSVNKMEQWWWLRGEPSNRSNNFMSCQYQIRWTLWSLEIVASSVYLFVLCIYLQKPNQTKHDRLIPPPTHKIPYAPLATNSLNKYPFIYKYIYMCQTILCLKRKHCADSPFEFERKKKKKKTEEAILFLIWN